MARWMKSVLNLFDVDPTHSEEVECKEEFFSTNMAEYVIRKSRSKVNRSSHRILVMDSIVSNQLN